MELQVIIDLSLAEAHESSALHATIGEVLEAVFDRPLSSCFISDFSELSDFYVPDGSESYQAFETRVIDEIREKFRVNIDSAAVTFVFLASLIVSARNARPT